MVSSNRGVDLLGFLAKNNIGECRISLKDRQAVILERIGVKSVCSNYSADGNPAAAKDRSGQKRLKTKNTDRNRRMKE